MAATRTAERVAFTPMAGAAELFTDAFCDYLLHLHDAFAPRIEALRVSRAEVLRRALEDGVLPAHPPVSEANTGDWQVPPVPEELKRPGIEISGPACITHMFINALNPGPGGARAAGDLDDDEDAAGHRLIDTVAAARNRLAAVERTLAFSDPERGREYQLAAGELPFFMHREARHTPRRTGTHDRWQTGFSGDSGYRAYPVPRRTRAGGKGPGYLFLPAEAGIGRRSRFLARVLRRQSGLLTVPA